MEGYHSEGQTPADADAKAPLRLAGLAARRCVRVTPLAGQGSAGQRGAVRYHTTRARNKGVSAFSPGAKADVQYVPE